MTADSPLLSRLLKAQRDDEAAVRFPNVEVNARRLVDYAAHFVEPALIPVGDAAHRLLAVAEHLTNGALDVPVWIRDLKGRQVLLVGTVTTSLIEFDLLAETFRRQGAAHVHGCAIQVQGPTESSLDSFMLLNQQSRQVDQPA